MHSRIGSIVVLCGAFACAITARGHSSEPSKAHIDTEQGLVRILEPAFSKAHTGVLVYFESTCKSRKRQNLLTLQSLPFPTVDVTPFKAAQSTEETIRRIFHRDKKVLINTNRDGTTYIKIGSADTVILNTKIDSIRLDPSSQYTPALAIYGILESASIRKAERQLGLSLLPRPMDLQVIAPAPGLAHMPSVIEDMTLDQALNLVATTFHGMVIYGSCEAWGVYDVRFVGEYP